MLTIRPRCGLNPVRSSISCAAIRRSPRCKKVHGSCRLSAIDSQFNTSQSADATLMERTSQAGCVEGLQFPLFMHGSARDAPLKVSRPHTLEASLPCLAPAQLCACAPASCVGRPCPIVRGVRQLLAAASPPPSILHLQPSCTAIALLSGFIILFSCCDCLMPNILGLRGCIARFCGPRVGSAHVVGWSQSHGGLSIADGRHRRDRLPASWPQSRVSY